MSLVPHFLNIHPSEMRKKKMEGKTIKNGILLDSSYNFESQEFEGIIMEEYLTDLDITRKEMDLYALASFQKTQKANLTKVYHESVVPVNITLETGGKKLALRIDQEFQRKDLSKISLFKSFFKPGGKITKANAAKFGDGAAFILASNEESIEKSKISNYKQLKGSAMTMTSSRNRVDASIDSTKKILKKYNLNIEDLSSLEINESYSSSPILFQRELKIKHKLINPFGSNVGRALPNSVGGLISLGHCLMTKGNSIVSSYDNNGEGVSILLS